MRTLACDTERSLATNDDRRHSDGIGDAATPAHKRIGPIAPRAGDRDATVPRIRVAALADHVAKRVADAGGDGHPAKVREDRTRGKG